MFRPPLILHESLQPLRVEPPHPASLEEEAILRECELRRGRTGGPGGQHRNKVQTMVEYVHRPTGLSAWAGERRSPTENGRVALRRLRQELAVRARVGAPGTRPSELWASRCRSGKIRCNTEHWDYPALLAEALDQVLDCHLDQKEAALRLECSATQLIRFVAGHPPAIVWWNAAREHKGLSPLRA